MAQKRSRSGNPAKRAAEDKRAAPFATTRGSHEQTNLKERADQRAGPGVVALYHVMYENETFEDVADHLHQIVKMAIEKQPSMKRALYIDIDGHRNEAGGFDDDSYELQSSFILGFLLPYLSEAHMPLVSVTNPRPQRNDIPPRLITMAGGPREERDATLLRQAQALGAPIWDAEEFNFLHPDGSRTDRDGKPA